MLRLAAALLALLATGAGLTVPLHGPSREEPPAPTPATPTPTPSEPVNAMIVSMPVACQPVPPPVPRPFHGTYEGALDPERREMTVTFPVVDATMLEQALVRFDIEGTSAGGHRVALIDPEGRTIFDQEGTLLALERAPLSGLYTARLSALAPVSETVRATVSVRYEATGPFAWTHEWPFALRLDAPHGVASMRLDVEDARPMELLVAWATPTFTDLELRILDDHGNALDAKRWQGSSPARERFFLSDEARAFEVRDLGASAPVSLALSLSAPRAYHPPPFECASPGFYEHEAAPAGG
jgi:hypothetical protein